MLEAPNVRCASNTGPLRLRASVMPHAFNRTQGFIIGFKSFAAGVVVVNKRGCCAEGYDGGEFPGSV